jgi:uncharacterized protein YbjQ (UPF0145 family)
LRHSFLADRPVDEAASKAHVEAGGLPLRAQRRIQELTTAGRPIFTSTLSPAETVVARATGLEPISQVMGSSIYHVGFPFSPYITAVGELQYITHAYEQARSRALARMEQEAALLGAHVVVDVRFEGRGYAWAHDLIEFTAVGTAVRLHGQPPAARPALTLLQPDELSKLCHAGYWPLGIAMGNCFFYLPHADCRSENRVVSAELPQHTAASAQARDIAVARFQSQVQALSAHGVVGVKVSRKAQDHEYEINDRAHTGFRVEIVALGTAVVKRAQAAAPPRPLLVMDLRDKPPPVRR